MWVQPAPRSVKAIPVSALMLAKNLLASGDCPEVTQVQSGPSRSARAMSLRPRPRRCQSLMMEILLMRAR
jgi:hypothetical protein